MFEDSQEHGLIDALHTLQQVSPDCGGVDGRATRARRAPSIRDPHEYTAVDRDTADEPTDLHPRELVGQAGAVPLQRSAEVVLAKLALTQLDQPVTMPKS